MVQWASPDRQRLLAEAPFADDQQDIIDVHGAVAINIAGAIYVRNAIAPGVDDREDVVHIDLAVTIGVGAFALVWNTVVVLVLRVAEGDITGVQVAVAIAVLGHKALKAIPKRLYSLCIPSTHILIPNFAIVYPTWF